MKAGTLRKALALGKKIKHVFVATADEAGLPHITAAGNMAVNHDGHLVIEEWFCPGAMANIQTNPGVSVVVWDEKKDAGYQIFGNVVQVVDVGMMNGYIPGEGMKSIPQVERRLIVHVDRIAAFSKASHSDQEE